jgi:RHS repeat-associated protein
MIALFKIMNKSDYIEIQTRIPALASTEAVEGQLLVNSADWDTDNLTLVYATMDIVNGYQLHRNTGFTYSEAPNKPVTLARGANNELFVSHSGAADLYLLGDNQLLPTTTGLAGYAFTGILPQQRHFVQDKDPVEINLYTRTLGNKRYELTDHLGNVRAAVSDRLKISPAAAGGDLEGAFYEADLQSTATYYPFGMTIGSLSRGSEGYRFGFQGQEKDDEVYGSSGSFLNFKYRGYDSRYGRFLSVDPLMAKYPFYSSYAFSGNRTIDMVELEGLEPEGYQYRLRGSVEIGMSAGLQLAGYLDIFESIGFKLQGPSVEGSRTYYMDYLFEDKQLLIGGEGESKNIDYAIAGTLFDVIGGEIARQSGVLASEEADKGTVRTKNIIFAEIKSVNGKEDESTWKAEISFGAEARVLLGLKLKGAAELSYAPLKGKNVDGGVSKTTTNSLYFEGKMFDFNKDIEQTGTEEQKPKTKNQK